MLIEDEVTVNITNKIIKYYQDKGYENIKIGDQVLVKISDLPRYCRKEIKVRCDNCNKEKSVVYSDYLTVFNKKNKYYCSDCKNVSIKKGVQDKYGVDNVFQLESTKEKTKTTCKEKYGVDHHLQNEEILNKTKKTNLERYGVEFIPQLKLTAWTNDEFIEMSNIVHDNYYDYSLTKYENCLSKVIIICPVHGAFVQMAKHHSAGSGCPKHGREKTKMSTVLGDEKFKKISNKIHNNKYDYSRVVYKNSYTKVEIGCPAHGYFFQKPNDHISSKAGCPVCKESKGEKMITSLLIEHNIKYEYQKTFFELKNINNLFFDFYLPGLNICIEFDGEQHFRPIEYWGGEKLFKELQLRDKLKNEYCVNNNISLIRIRYDEDIFEKLNSILF